MKTLTLLKWLCLLAFTLPLVMGMSTETIVMDIPLEDDDSLFVWNAALVSFSFPFLSFPFPSLPFSCLPTSFIFTFVFIFIFITFFFFFWLVV